MDASVIALEGHFAPPEAPRRVRYVSVVLPCLNEEEAVGDTVREAYRGLALARVDGEVLVVDNGSTDDSVALAEAAGARVIHEVRRGYGAAHLSGIAAAQGDVVIMADADLTYDLENLGLLLTPLADGADMVVANRLVGITDPKAMPFLHRYLGTPVITRMLKTITRVPIADSQSGYRAFWRDRILDLNLRASGMEYASEMLLRAGRAGWRVEEIPSTYRERVGESKLDTFSDGWRHLKLLLVMSPHLSLMLPGLILAVLGLGLSAISLFAPMGVGIGDARWLPVFLGPMLLIVGGQALFLGALAAHRSDLTPVRVRGLVSFLDRKDAVEFVLVRFALVLLVGIVIDAVLLGIWVAGESGTELLGVAGIAQALIVMGFMGLATVMGAEFAGRSLEA